MKTFFTIALGFLSFYMVNAQASLFNEAFRFNKFMDRVNSPKGDQLNYADIEGNAYFAKTFISANIENATNLVKTRYNMYTDTVELLNEETIFELPKSTKYGRIVFQNPPAVLLFLNESSIAAGYYFELVKGKYTLLKKMKTEFREGSKAINSFTPAISPRFENLNPEYFLKTETGFIKVTKSSKDFEKAMPAQQTETADFIKKNKLKLNNEEDLIKLVKFLNSPK